MLEWSGSLKTEVVAQGGDRSLSDRHQTFTPTLARADSENAFVPVDVSEAEIQELETGCPSGVMPSFIRARRSPRSRPNLVAQWGGGADVRLVRRRLGRCNAVDGYGPRHVPQGQRFASFTNADQHWALTPRGVFNGTKGIRCRRWSQQPRRQRACPCRRSETPRIAVWTC